MQERICGHVCVYVYAYMSDGWMRGSRRGRAAATGGYGHYSSQQTTCTLLEQAARLRWIEDIWVGRGGLEGVLNSSHRLLGSQAG